MGHERVDGWPELQVVEHHVPSAQMRERCMKYVGPGMLPEACAEFDLANRRCDIWVSSDFPVPKIVMKHERMHCAGYDHIGDDNMRSLLARYRAQQEIAARFFLRMARRHRLSSGGRTVP